MREHNEVVSDNYWSTVRDEIFMTHQGNMVNLSHFDIFMLQSGLGESKEWGVVATKLQGRTPGGLTFLDSEILIWFGSEQECRACQQFVADILGGVSIFNPETIGE